MKYIINEAQLSEIVRNTINKVLLSESKQDDLAKEYLRNHGYEDNEYYLTEECAFVLTMQSLNSDGSPKYTYQYADESDGESTGMGGIWSDAKTGTVIDKDNDVTIGAGEGFWLDCPPLHDSATFTFVVPACL